MPGSAYSRYQSRTGVRNGGRSGVGNQRYGFSFGKACDHLLRSGLFVVFVCRQQAGVAAIVLEQGRAMARILGSDPRYLTQDLDGALRHVPQISEWRRDYI